ncbi:MAG TPA: agmatine deiminase family protein [Geminicoccaceae bacterium]
MTTPRARGFAMPPEWAPHERCWMAWPCREEIFGPAFAGARRACAEIARAIARTEPVSMLARPDLIADASLASGRGVSVVPMDYDDAWPRDTAPTFVLDRAGTLAAVDWRFNGYGGRSPKFDQDAALAARIAERLQIERFEAPLVFEGGAVHVDGEGTAIVAAPSVLDPGRSPGRSREDIDQVLGDCLGVDRVIWLEHGFEGDETGGHVDNLACFAAPGKVLALSSRDANDPNHEGLQANVATLKAAEDAQGRTLEVIEVVQPKARHREDGRRLTTSYINFYLANGAVILPMFDDARDDDAYAAVEAAFPEREIVPIDAVDLVHGGGGIHCITQQQPARPPGDAGKEA